MSVLTKGRVNFQDGFRAGYESDPWLEQEHTSKCAKETVLATGSQLG